MSRCGIGLLLSPRPALIGTACHLGERKREREREICEEGRKEEDALLVIIDRLVPAAVLVVVAARSVGRLVG